MATFYGTVKGRSSVASRTGSYSSGIRATVQSWKGSVIVEMNQADKDGEPIIDILINDSGSSASGTCVFNGTIEELKRRLSE